MDEKQEIYLYAADGLACCQRLEFDIKYYLSGAMQLIKKYVGGRMPFNPPEDFDMALGKLIQILKQYFDDKGVIKELEGFVKERNYLAHQALVLLENPGGDIEDSCVLELRERIDRLTVKSNELRGKVCLAVGNIWAQVWFDDETAEKEAGVNND